ncbi:hypothetical protein ACRALDRAFT_207701 [Sodiomyces alcalophilus JCM 7366]|uniref:uncharacterized protein n=1 Tax=Sodiomyces alcalophilus JCM 7366 TaxID=591952 RepID=UPI0039B566CC
MNIRPSTQFYVTNKPDKAKENPETQINPNNHEPSPIPLDVRSSRPSVEEKTRQEDAGPLQPVATMASHPAIMPENLPSGESSPNRSVWNVCRLKQQMAGKANEPPIHSDTPLAEETKTETQDSPSPPTPDKGKESQRNE